MDISLQDKTKTQKQIEVTISVEEMQPYISKALKAIGAGVQLPGFRAGKAPADRVRATLGEGKIWEEAAQYALQESFEKSCREHEFELLSLSAVEVLKLAPGNDFQYRATIEVVAPMALCDFRAVAREVSQKEHRAIIVGEKEVEDTIEWLAKSRATYREVDREVRPGDVVEIQYEGEIAGVTQEGLEQKTGTVIVGEGSVPQDLDEALVGMKQGEEKDVAVTFPKNAPDPRLQEKSVDMHVVLEGVKEREIPAVDETFAKGLGGFSSVEDLKKSIRDGIRLEKEKREEERITILQLEEIARKSYAEAPRVLLDQELERMKEEFSHGLAEIGITIPDYLQQIKKTEQDLKIGWVEKAKNRVNAGLVLRAIAKQEKIEPDEEEIEKRANTTLARYKNKKEAEEHEGSAQELRARLAGAIRNEKVLELLKGFL